MGMASFVNALRILPSVRTMDRFLLISSLARTFCMLRTISRSLCPFLHSRGINKKGSQKAMIDPGDVCEPVVCSGADLSPG